MANLLILHPKDPFAAPDRDAIVTRLEGLGFIADRFDFEGRPHLRPGDEFLHLLTFLGCSPVVALGAPGVTGEEFAHVAIEESTPEPLFLAGENVKTPRCPSCGYRDEAWRTHLPTWSAAPHHLWQCPECAAQHPFPDLRWRQCAGFGRLFIRIWGVFEGEAVPGEHLMTALEQLTGAPWKYFYLREANRPGA